jgi:DinB superfamily
MTTKRRAATADAVSGEIAILLQALDEGYDRKAWHGPNLKGSIRGLSAATAAWRPRPDRHSIAENVVHAAYWKYAVRRRLVDEKRRSFALKGSNWFTLASPMTEPDWRRYIALLDAEHRMLRGVVASFPAPWLRLVPPGGKVSYIKQILGIAMHDVYHAGQIQLLKRLQVEAK